jgi:phenylpyruvate tautomerase PptA (4-oxalocrotonate tautomerase family)
MQLCHPLAHAGEVLVHELRRQKGGLQVEKRELARTTTILVHKAAGQITTEDRTQVVIRHLD